MISFENIVMSYKSDNVIKPWIEYLLKGLIIMPLFGIDLPGLTMFI